MKFINSWQAAFSALVLAATCATGCVASEQATATPADEPARADQTIRVDEPMLDSQDWLTTPGGSSSDARQNGDCCNANCTNGFHGINLPLTSGCDAWAESFCRNAWAPPQRLVKAYWGGC